MVSKTGLHQFHLKTTKNGKIGQKSVQIQISKFGRKNRKLNEISEKSIDIRDKPNEITEKSSGPRRRCQ
jgi:hypothetical protein